MARRHRGFALLTAIWILAVLLILVGGFAAMTHSEALIARNYGDQARARWAAREGMRRAEAQVMELAKQPYTDLGGDVLELSSADEAGNEERDTTCQVAVTDEAGKININTAPPEVLQQLLPPEVADAVVDWRDADSRAEQQGAEDDYYTALTPPYHCKNAPFTTVRELLLVKGVTQDLLSTPLTENGRPLEDLLTVDSVDRNTDAEGQPRLNVKTASKEQWTSRCGDTLSEQDIDAIIKQRTSSPFDSPADLLSVPDLAREKVSAIYDRLTATQEETRKGLVNINTAPAEVLAVLPGTDEAVAQTIVQTRTTQGPYAGVGDLLEIQGLSNNTFRRVADLLTTRSQIFRATSTGTYKEGISVTVTGLLQTELAAGKSSVRTLYWREQ